jgi:hypothetical protein
MDSRQQRLILTRDLNVIDEDKGHLRLFLTGDESAALPSKTLRYSVVLTRPDNVQVLLMTDKSRRAHGQATVLDGPLPDPIEPITITLDDMTMQTSVYYSGAYAGAAMVDNETGLHSAAIRLDDFTGSVLGQGSLEQAPSQDVGAWFPVAAKAFDEHTGLAHIPFEGQLMWVRFLITVTDGDLVSITYRN